MDKCKFQFLIFSNFLLIPWPKNIRESNRFEHEVLRANRAKEQLAPYFLLILKKKIELEK